MTQLPIVYNKSLLSFANQNITDPVQYAFFLVKGQLLLDEREEAQSRVRIQERCNQVKEEIMMRAWCPERVEKLLHLGYDIEEM